MAKYQDKTAVLDEKLKLVTTAGNQLHLLDVYTAGDLYATVVGNSLGFATVIPGDWVFADHTSNGRKASLAGKTGTASGTAAAGDRHLALIDTVNSLVLHVDDETSNQAITSGNAFSFPTIEIRENQPV